MTAATMKQVMVTANRRAELVDAPVKRDPLAPDELAGPTVATAVSAGTELAMCYAAKDGFPRQVGYAATFRVEQAGEGVSDVAAGDVVFCMGPHASWQRQVRANVVPVPAALPPEQAVFARLMGVSMATLSTTTARPPGKVLVTGLGPVGHLAAKLFAACGYDVTAVDPIAARRDMLAAAGRCRVETAVPADLADQVDLVVECSGHEQAVLDGCKVVRKRGEVALVGVPWRACSDMLGHALLHAVFHRYAVVRSGWEWELARRPADFRTGSIFANYAAALAWLAEGRVSVAGLYRKVAPADCQQVYDDLFGGRFPALAAVFDWTAP